MKWVNVVKLKEMSVWDVEIQKNESWGWKSILEVRDLVGRHMKRVCSFSRVEWFLKNAEWNVGRIKSVSSFTILCYNKGFKTYAYE